MKKSLDGAYRLLDRPCTCILNPVAHSRVKGEELEESGSVLRPPGLRPGARIATRLAVPCYPTSICATNAPTQARASM